MAKSDWKCSPIFRAFTSSLAEPSNNSRATPRLASENTIQAMCLTAAEHKSQNAASRTARIAPVFLSRNNCRTLPMPTSRIAGV
eukprot:11225429-Lingulodinium_polyedra.AAC.1